MTPEQLDAIESRANRSADHVAKLCTKEERWRMSVPPKDSDSDLMLLRSLEKDVPTLVAEVRRLQVFHDHEKGRADELEAQIAEGGKP